MSCSLMSSAGPIKVAFEWLSISTTRRPPGGKIVHRDGSGHCGVSTSGDGGERAASGADGERLGISSGGSELERSAVKEDVT